MRKQRYNAAFVVFASFDTNKTYKFCTKPVSKCRSWYYREIPGMFGTYTAGIHHRYYRYRHISMFGTATIPVPETLVSPAWHSYQYRTLRYVQYDIHADTVHIGKFDTIWIPVPGTSVTPSMPVPDTLLCSVQHRSRYRTHH